jgi:hypothetical protein
MTEVDILVRLLLRRVQYMKEGLKFTNGLGVPSRIDDDSNVI